MKKRILLTTLCMLFCFSLGAFGAARLEIIQVSKNSGKFYTVAWKNIDPQRTGEQRRILLQDTQVQRKIKMVERRLIFYDGSEQHQFFDTFYESGH